jgi:hypothetical protein
MSLDSQGQLESLMKGNLQLREENAKLRVEVERLTVELRETACDRDTQIIGIGQECDAKESAQVERDAARTECQLAICRAQNAELQVSAFERRLSEAVNARCSCGGAGPGEGCDWCNLYHHVKGSAEKREDVLLGDFKDNGCFQPESKRPPPQEFRVYTSDGKYRIVDGKFQAPQILAPSGSCPCRMEGETLIACERHAMKQKGPSGGHVDGPDRPDRTDHPFHR